MKKIAALFILAAINPLTAIAKKPAPLLLDKIVFQISAKQWVSTQTALLTVHVNAALSGADLVKARADIMSNLGKIASGDWHITQFDRSQDNSGLDKLYVQAQVRVPQASLTDIYQSAKNVSKPGATYGVTNVEFKPSLEDVQAAKLQLREQLYKLVNDEMNRMNKVYSSQHYSVNHLIVTEGDVVVPLQPRAYKAQMNTMAMEAPSAPALTVSNELIMTALVEAASNRVGGAVVAEPSH